MCSLVLLAAGILGNSLALSAGVPGTKHLKVASAARAQAP